MARRRKTEQFEAEGEPVCENRLGKGSGRQRLSTSAGEAVLKVAKGSVAEIECHGQVALRGIFERD